MGDAVDESGFRLTGPDSWARLNDRALRGFGRAGRGVSQGIRPFGRVFREAWAAGGPFPRTEAQRRRLQTKQLKPRHRTERRERPWSVFIKTAPFGRSWPSGSIGSGSKGQLIGKWVKGLGKVHKVKKGQRSVWGKVFRSAHACPRGEPGANDVTLGLHCSPL